MYFWAHNTLIHNALLNGCFCDECRTRRTAHYVTFSTEDLFDAFNKSLPDLERKQLLKVHETVLKTIVVGKTYKEKCLFGTGLVQFKSWANREARQGRQFHDWSPTRLKKFCDSVNAAAIVYDKWDTIVTNLMQPEIDILDAKRFSIGQFRLAVDLNWCRIENENLRPSQPKSDDPAYPEDLYKTILDAVTDSGILQAIGNDPRVAVRIGKRLQKDIIQLNKRQRR